MKSQIALFFLSFISYVSIAQDNTTEAKPKTKKISVYGSAVGGIYNGFTGNVEYHISQSKSGNASIRLRAGAGGINKWGADRGRSTVKGGAIGFTMLWGREHHFFELSPTLFVGKTSRQSDLIFGYPQPEIAYRYVNFTGITARLQLGFPYVGVSLGLSL